MSDHRQDDDGSHSLLRRFASFEVKLIVDVTKWLLFVGVIGTGLEFAASYLTESPRLKFAGAIFDPLADFILSCDAGLLALFVFVATLLSAHMLLQMIGINVVRMA